uniref:Uncharacterized protein n=1 Tax=Rhizophora mucronata TaxID=61149 RepID=A0A2P2NB30_RHIMU
MMHETKIAVKSCHCRLQHRNLKLWTKKIMILLHVNEDAIVKGPHG